MLWDEARRGGIFTGTGARICSIVLTARRSACFGTWGRGKFEDVAARVSLVDPVGLGCWAATFADYDNDGYEDIFLTGNGWGGFNRLFLFHNEKAGAS